MSGKHPIVFQYSLPCCWDFQSLIPFLCQIESKEFISFDIVGVLLWIEHYVIFSDIYLWGGICTTTLCWIWKSCLLYILPPSCQLSLQISRLSAFGVLCLYFIVQKKSHCTYNWRVPSWRRSCPCLIYAYELDCILKYASIINNNLYLTELSTRLSILGNKYESLGLALLRLCAVNAYSPLSKFLLD